jgi:hypothetical protein
VVGSFVSTLPTSVVAGSAGTVKLRLSNASGNRFSGPVTIGLYASTDAAVSITDGALVTSLSIDGLKLKDFGSRTIKMNFTYPAGLAEGEYSLVTSIQAVATNALTAVANGPSAVMIVAPRVDLSAAFGTRQPVLVKPGRRTSVTVTLTNLGNVTAMGAMTVGLFSSSDPVPDTSDPPLVTLPAKAIRMLPGMRRSFRVRFIAPESSPGTYSLIAKVTSALPSADQDPANDVAVAATG